MLFSRRKFTDTPIGINVKYKFLSTYNDRKCFDNWSLNIYSKFSYRLNFSSYFYKFSWRFSCIEAQKTSSYSIPIVITLVGHASEFDKVNDDFWAMSGVEVLSRSFGQFVSHNPQCLIGLPQSEGEESNKKCGYCCDAITIIIPDLSGAPNKNGDIIGDGDRERE